MVAERIAGGAGDRPGDGPGGARTGHALALVEFSRVLELVAGHATSVVGARKVFALHPGTSSTANGAPFAWAAVA